MAIRTDLAAEVEQLHRGRITDSTGIRKSESNEGGVERTQIEILSQETARELALPMGNYVTLSFDGVRRREQSALSDAADALAAELERLCPLSPEAGVLVACLGNPDVTPDAIGPLTARKLLITRHLVRQLPEYFGRLRQVSVVETGVLGTTGMESAEVVAAAAELVQPAALIAVDALAASSFDRLFCTVQLSDCGIVPGSGVGNARAEISRATLGIPVFSVGIPTVIDAASLLEAHTKREEPSLRGLIVTSKDVDARLREAVSIVAGGLNQYLHASLQKEDLEWMLGT